MDPEYWKIIGGGGAGAVVVAIAVVLKQWFVGRNARQQLDNNRDEAEREYALKLRTAENLWKSERYTQMNSRIVELEKQCREISEQHQECLENAAVQSQQLGRLEGKVEALESIVGPMDHHHAAGHITCDGEQKIVEWSPGATQLFGWTAEEAIGRKVSILIPARLRGKHESSFHRSMEDGTDPSAETAAKLRESVGMRKDGTEVPVQITLSSWGTEGKRMYSAEIKRR